MKYDRYIILNFTKLCYWSGICSVFTESPTITFCKVIHCIWSVSVVLVYLIVSICSKCQCIIIFFFFCTYLLTSLCFVHTWLDILTDLSFVPFVIMYLRLYAVDDFCTFLLYVAAVDCRALESLIGIIISNISSWELPKSAVCVY